MQLCKACRGISVKKLAKEPFLVSLKCQHLPDARMLIESARECRLCALFMNVIIDAIKENSPGAQAVPNEQWFLPEPLTVESERDIPFAPQFNNEESLLLTGLEIRPPMTQAAPSQEIGTLVMDLYAEEGSAAAESGDVGGRPCLLSSDSSEAHMLLNRWLQSCVQTHERCSKTLSGCTVDEVVGPVLPTRVIDVGLPGSSTQPCLKETGGIRGLYTALSHCWGPPHKRPLVTTTNNLHDHLSAIPFHTLPKTFQDAITITRVIGLQYLWIDSLCIIQDDSQDWARESANMGLIYEGSRLTIAASHAHDASEGCFMPRPELPPAVELPYITADGSTLGSMFVRQRGTEADRQAEEGPLEKRAWITQEWYLSRRMVFYTKFRLQWGCRTFSADEAGLRARFRAREKSWENVVEGYSRRTLTYQTDKLAAMQGLATELQKMRPNDRYFWGMWKENLLSQLLWVGRTRLSKSPAELRIPSWSWMSKMGAINPGIVFPTPRPESIRQIPCCKIEALDDSGLLEVEGSHKPIPEIQAIKYRFRGPTLHDVDIYACEGDDSSPLQNLHPTWRLNIIKRHLATSDVGRQPHLFLSSIRNATDTSDYTQEIIGVGTIDAGDLPVGQPISCLLLVNDMRRDDWCRERFLILQPSALDPARAFERVGLGMTFHSTSENSFFEDVGVRIVRVL